MCGYETLAKVSPIGEKPTVHAAKKPEVKLAGVTGGDQFGLEALAQTAHSTDDRIPDFGQRVRRGVVNLVRELNALIAQFDQKFGANLELPQY